MILNNIMTNTMDTHNNSTITTTTTTTTTTSAIHDDRTDTNVNTTSNTNDMFASPNSKLPSNANTNTNTNTKYFKSLNTKDLPPTNHITYQLQTNENGTHCPFTSPLQFDQSPFVSSSRKRRNVNVNKNRIRYVNSNSNRIRDVNSTRMRDVTGSVNSNEEEEEEEESSIEISIYKPKKTKSKSKSKSKLKNNRRVSFLDEQGEEEEIDHGDDDEYEDEDEDSDTEYKNEEDIDHDDDDDDEEEEDYDSNNHDEMEEHSFIIQEPYIPYGRKVSELDSAGKKFVKNELLYASEDDNDNEDEIGTSYEDNDSETETEDDEDEEEDESYHHNQNGKKRSNSNITSLTNSTASMSISKMNSLNKLSISVSSDSSSDSTHVDAVLLQDASLIDADYDDDDENGDDNDDDNVNETSDTVEAELVLMDTEKIIEEDSVTSQSDKSEEDNYSYSSDSDHVVLLEDGSCTHVESDTHTDTDANTTSTKIMNVKKTDKNYEKQKKNKKKEKKIATLESNPNSKVMSRQLSNSSNGSGNHAGKVKRGKWSLGSRIGEGSFGIVYVGMNNLTGKLMAVKSLHIPISSPNEIMEDLQREIDLMQSFKHQNIVRYIGAEMNSSKHTLYIFQEWVTGGSITSLLNKFGPFPTAVVRSYFHQILCGLEYLHSNRILHRDIKGGNVLVNDEGVVKLADFGASKKIHVTKNGTVIDMEDMMEQMTMRGTPYFMAPEVFETTYGPKADVWSAGCVCHQMCTGLPPWKGMGLKSPTSLFMHLRKTSGPPPLMENIENGELRISKKPASEGALHNLLTRCFERDATKRPTVQLLLEDTFFTENDLNESVFDDESVAHSSSVNVANVFHRMSPVSPISPQKLAEWKNNKETNQGTCNVNETFDKQDWPLWARENPERTESPRNPFARN
jgi:serine/threonine protein kinase